MSTNEDVTLPGVATDASAPPIEKDRLAPGDATVIALLLVSAFVVILNETIMSVALPHLMVDLGISARTVQWLTRVPSASAP